MVYSRARGQYLPHSRRTTSAGLQSGLHATSRPDLNSNSHSNHWTQSKRLRPSHRIQSASQWALGSASGSQDEYREHPARLYPPHSSPPGPRTRNSDPPGDRACGYGWNLPPRQANWLARPRSRGVRSQVNAVLQPASHRDFDGDAITTEHVEKISDRRGDSELLGLWLRLKRWSRRSDLN